MPPFPFPQFVITRGDLLALGMSTSVCTGNSAPIAEDQLVSLDEDVSRQIILSASDSENDSLTFMITGQPAHGTLSGTAPNLIYTPNLNFYGSDSFEFQVNDGEFDSNIATVSITVNSVNDYPVITPAALPPLEAATGTTTVIANVTDVDNDVNSLLVTPAAVPAGISITNITNTNGTITATVSAGCSTALGSNTVVLQVSDGELTSSVDLVVNVTAETVPPVIDPIQDVIAYLPLNSTATSMAVSFQHPTASDNCTANPLVTTDPVSGSVFPVGATIVNVEAEDASGNKAQSSFKVSVIYNFSGFSEPIGVFPIENIVRAGQSIPVKFSLSGNKGIDILAPGSPTSWQTSCDYSADTSLVEETETAGNSTLTYDAAADEYKYIWKTEKSWAGQCRQLIVTLKDGTTHFANFQFR